MADDNWFQICQRYKALVVQEKAKAIVCAIDQVPLAIGIVWNNGVIQDVPLFWCPGCGSEFHPGLDILSQMRAVVKEHYVD